MKQAFALRRPLVIAALAATLAVPAGAQTTSSTTSSTTGADTWHMPYQTNFWNYIGATVGGSDFNLDCVAGFNCDHHATAFKIVAGGKLYNAFGLEFGYMNAGHAEFGGGPTRAQGGNLSLVAGLPLFGNTFAINGKVGATYGWTKNNVAVLTPCTGVGTCTTYQGESDRGWGVSYGAGATYAIARNIELRVDWDRTRLPFAGVGHQDVDMWTGGVNFRF